MLFSETAEDIPSLVTELGPPRLPVLCVERHRSRISTVTKLREHTKGYFDRLAIVDIIGNQFVLQRWLV